MSKKHALKGPPPSGSESGRTYVSKNSFVECDRMVSQLIPPLGIHIMLTWQEKESLSSIQPILGIFFNYPERVQIKKVRWVK